MRSTSTGKGSQIHKYWRSQSDPQVLEKAVRSTSTGGASQIHKYWRSHYAFMRAPVDRLCLHVSAMERMRLFSSSSPQTKSFFKLSSYYSTKQMISRFRQDCPQSNTEIEKRTAIEDPLKCHTGAKRFLINVISRLTL